MLLVFSSLLFSNYSFHTKPLNVFSQSSKNGSDVMGFMFKDTFSMVQPLNLNDIIYSLSLSVSAVLLASKVRVSSNTVEIIVNK